MSEKIRYTGERLGDLEAVPDFLPRPEDLVFRDESVKITITLSKRTVEFFKIIQNKLHFTATGRTQRGAECVGGIEDSDSEPAVTMPGPESSAANRRTSMTTWSMSRTWKSTK